MTSNNSLPSWITERITPTLPPVALRAKPLPEWTRAERDAFEPSGMVWDRDGQRWTQGY